MRVYQYLPYLEEHGVECTVRPFTDSELYAILHEDGHGLQKVAGTLRGVAGRLRDTVAARRYDVVFVHREAAPLGPPLLELLMAKANPRLVFDFDDAIYLPYPYATQMKGSLLYRFKYGRGFDRVARASRLVIAGNSCLAEHARTFNPNTVVLPTVVDTDRYRAAEPRLSSTSRPVRLGWIGSGTTAPYLASVRRPFAELARRFGDRIELLAIGYPGVMDSPIGVTQRAWSLDRELADVYDLDIGLMPLADDEWSRGKCAFKAIQYMAAAKPSVSSAVGPIEEMVEDGRNGFLCRTEEDWFEKLSRLIEDPDLRRRVGEAGRSTIEEGFSVKHAAPRLLELLRSVA